MRKYRVTIDLDAFEIVVSANNKAEAKRKAIEKLQRKRITSLIRKSWPNNKKEEPAPTLAPTHAVRRRGEHNDDTNEPAAIWMYRFLS